jgi:hypothetical protein
VLFLYLIKYKMTMYDTKKNILVSQQKKLFRKNDFRGVVNKFDEIDANITANCPSHRVGNERFKFRQKTSEWNSFSPGFTLNEKLDSFFDIGIEKPCVKIGEFIYHFEIPRGKRPLSNVIPLLRNRQLIDASDGVYTWFIYTDIYGYTQFVAKKALTVQEITTKHMNIISDIIGELKTYHYAGEFKKIGHAIEINFLSGTFMARPFEVAQANSTTTQLTNEAVTFLNEKYEGALVFTNQNPVETLITETNILYTRENLELLLKSGVLIKRFDDKRSCNNYDKRETTKIQAKAAYDYSINIWKKYGGTEPVFIQPVDVAYVNITLKNLDEVVFQ